ncbi:uncharacterized protein LOC109798119 isoform X2 [Cajanus cajan]|uniref:uncharacterized protein LOC109798119 isoform X2 n=1 Tax=Cajanus cajan TaxID=3821 RepID=UPI00098DA81A|nr:uncharacterized protein LOC109798119 isoform X2 [Cajanus cajan]
MGKTACGTRSSWGLWMGGFGTVVHVMRKLHTTFSRAKGVKQGHFVVIATQGWKPERFFVELGFLDHPDFVKLLNQAEEEFGFSQVGALAIPCQPDDLKRIINGGSSKNNRNNNKAVTHAELKGHKKARLCTILFSYHRCIVGDGRFFFLLPQSKNVMTME